MAMMGHKEEGQIRVFLEYGVWTESDPFTWQNSKNAQLAESVIHEEDRCKTWY